jgi:hypothetical protein
MADDVTLHDIADLLDRVLEQTGSSLKILDRIDARLTSIETNFESIDARLEAMALVMAGETNAALSRD